MIIYTCITNGYDEIPDHYYDPDVQYVCLTDGTIEKKGPWEFRDILFEHEDPVRLSTHPKQNPPSSAVLTTLAASFSIGV